MTKEFEVVAEVAGAYVCRVQALDEEHARTQACNPHADWQLLSPRPGMILSVSALEDDVPMTVALDYECDESGVFQIPTAR